MFLIKLIYENNNKKLQEYFKCMFSDTYNFEKFISNFNNIKYYEQELNEELIMVIDCNNYEIFNIMKTVLKAY